MTGEKGSSSKKIIGIDIDNVLTNTDLVIRRLIEQEYGIKSKRGEMIYWRYSDSLPITLKQEKHIFDLFHEYYCIEALPIPSCSKALRILSKKYSIWLLTHRPKETNTLTIEWLKKHRIIYDILIHTGNKEKYTDQIDLLIEDNGKTAKLFVDNNIPVILFDNPWNSDYFHPLIFRVKNWNQVLYLFNVDNFLSNSQISPLTF